MRLPPKIRIMVATSTTVESALMVGETPNRIIEYIFSGSVLDPTTATQNLLTKPSKERVNARRAQAKTPRSMSCNVIRKNLGTGDAGNTSVPSSTERTTAESRTPTTVV